MQAEILNNLLTAMHGEAFAYVKYKLFAEHARKNGRTELAELFERTANLERFGHFMEEAELYGLIGSDAANLRNAIQGESYEVETKYGQFAEQAVAVGDQAAADPRFAKTRWAIGMLLRLLSRDWKSPEPSQRLPSAEYWSRGKVRCIHRIASSAGPSPAPRASSTR